jgi:TRAP transporter TAXI family solute receptor
MMQPRHCATGLLGFCAVLMLLSGCARGPEAQALRVEVQEKLTRQLKPGLLEVVAFERRGSAPLPAAANGAARIIVYYNTTLRFAQDYAFGSWENLSPASLAYLLGAQEKGLIGIKPQNRAGDLLYVYGTTTLEASGTGWKSVALVGDGVKPAPDVENTAPPLRSKQLIDKLAAMLDIPPPGVGPEEDQVISEELVRAAENISRRLERNQRVFTFASGPSGGQYTRFGVALIEGIAKAGGKAVVRNRETDGSVQNARLLARGEADYALIQSDVAARAVAGEAPFAREGPFNTLRALGSLFPEPIHIVVPADSPIRKVSDLRGKRVDIGLPHSGTQYDAGLIQEAHGLQTRDLAKALQGGAEAAMRQLQAGELDAFFVTTAAPARNLQDLAARHAIRLLSLQEQGIARLVASSPGLVPITLPAHTYPAQAEPITTIATVALLVTTSEVPEAEVERLAKLVFSGVNFAPLASAEGAKVSQQTALRGITIPMHPGASRYFGALVGSR